MAPDFQKINRRFGPWFSLGLSVLATAFMRRGAEAAPLAIGVLLLAWTAAVLFSREVELYAAMDTTQAPRRRRVAPLLRIAATSLYQNVLFFTAPLWLASATWVSLNVVFPLLLAAMAFFSCFELPYTRLVLAVPRRRAVWSAVVLFSALVPAGPALVRLPLSAYVAAASGLAALAGSISLVRETRHHPISTALVLVCPALLAAALGWLALPVLPPVPVQCTAHFAATAIANREPQNTADTFPRNVPRVYAWFAVAAPAGYAQTVHFQWFHGGVADGVPIPSKVSGGRKAGFRTWTYLRAPARGVWRVELRTTDGQLVSQQRFEVK